MATYSICAFDRAHGDDPLSSVAGTPRSFSVILCTKRSLGMKSERTSTPSSFLKSFPVRYRTNPPSCLAVGRQRFFVFPFIEWVLGWWVAGGNVALTWSAWVRPLEKDTRLDCPNCIIHVSIPPCRAARLWDAFCPRSRESAESADAKMKAWSEPQLSSTAVL